MASTEDAYDQIEMANTEDDQIEIACCLLIDAINFRNPPCRITKRRSIVGSWYYFWPARVFLVLLCILLLILPFMEHQNSFSSSPAYNIHNETIPESYMKYFYVAVSIEGVCLGLLTVSCIIRCYLVFSKPCQFWKFYWTSPLSSTYRSEFHLVIMYILAIVVTWFVWAISIGLYNKNGHSPIQHYLLFTRQLIRPLFLIVHVHLIRKVIKAITLSFMSMLRLIFLLGLIIFLFALIGVIILETVKEDEYFGSVHEAYWSLLVYLTTSNSPDILRSAYNENRLYFIYFGTYFLLCNQFILNILEILLAAKFVFTLKKSVRRSYENRLISLRNTFEELKFNRPASNVVKKEDVNRVFNKLKRNESNYSRTELENLEWSEFRDLCIDQPEFKNIGSYAAIAEKVTNPDYLLNILNCSAYDDCKSSHGYRMKYILYVFHFLLNFLSTFVAISHVIVVTVFIANENNDGLIIATSIFSCLFIPEIFIRVFITPLFYFYLKSQYERVTDLLLDVLLRVSFADLTDLKDAIAHHLNPNNIIVCISYALDLAATIIVTILGFLLIHCALDNDCLKKENLLIYQITNVLVFFRFMVKVFNNRCFSDVFHTLLNAVILLVPLGMLASILYYIFAVTGIFIFQYEVKIQASLNLSTLAECGTYEQLRYHSFNFQDFGTALVTMWNLMLINNWFIIVEAFVKSTSTYFGIFFVIWWIITETILIGILFGTLLYIIEQAFSESDENPSRNENDDENASHNKLYRLMQKLMKAVGIKSDKRSSFKSLINTWNIFHVKSLDDTGNRELREVDGDCIHPDIAREMTLNSPSLGII